MLRGSQDDRSLSGKREKKSEPFLKRTFSKTCNP